jgi:hypothetical protein
MGGVWQYFQQLDFWVAALAGVAVNAAAGLLKPEREWLWRRRRARIAGLNEDFRERLEAEGGPPVFLLEERSFKEGRSHGFQYLAFGAFVHVLAAWLTDGLDVPMRHLLLGMGGCVTVWCVVHATREFVFASDARKRMLAEPPPPTGLRGQ